MSSHGWHRVPGFRPRIPALHRAERFQTVPPANDKDFPFHDGDAELEPTASHGSGRGRPAVGAQAELVHSRRPFGGRIHTAHDVQGTNLRTSSMHETSI